MKNFEEYLRAKHADQYTGLDDDMPDDFDNWLSDLEAYEWLNFGDTFQMSKHIETLGEFQETLKSL